MAWPGKQGGRLLSSCWVDADTCCSGRHVANCPQAAQQSCSGLLDPTSTVPDLLRPELPPCHRFIGELCYPGFPCAAGYSCVNAFRQVRQTKE